MTATWQVCESGLRSIHCIATKRKAETPTQMLDQTWHTGALQGPESRHAGIDECLQMDHEHYGAVVMMPTSRSKVLIVRAMSSFSSSSPSETSSWLEVASSMADIWPVDCIEAATGKELCGKTRPRTLMATSVSCHRPKCTRPMDPSPMTFLKVCSRPQRSVYQTGVTKKGVGRGGADSRSMTTLASSAQLTVAVQGCDSMERQKHLWK